MKVEKECWGSIPLLHVYNEQMTADTPVMIFLHGFMSAKEHNLHYAYNLVERGVRVIMPDAYLHGERDEGFGEVQMNLAFWQIVLNNIAEVGRLYQDIRKRGFHGKIALGGTSMGGITTAGCLKVYPWIDVACIMMGAVNYTKLLQHQMNRMMKSGVQLPLSDSEIKQLEERLATFNVDKSIDIFEQVPTIFWHGRRDKTVPFEMTYPFYEWLKQSSDAHKVTYIIDERAGHAVSRQGILAIVKFVADYLA